MIEIILFYSSHPFPTWDLRGSFHARYERFLIGEEIEEENEESRKKKTLFSLSRQRNVSNAYAYLHVLPWLLHNYSFSISRILRQIKKTVSISLMPLSPSPPPPLPSPPFASFATLLYLFPNATFPFFPLIFHFSFLPHFFFFLLPRSSRAKSGAGSPHDPSLTSTGRTDNPPSPPHPPAPLGRNPPTTRVREWKEKLGSLSKSD